MLKYKPMNTITFLHIQTPKHITKNKQTNKQIIKIIIIKIKRKPRLLMPCKYIDIHKQIIHIQTNINVWVLSV